MPSDMPEFLRHLLSHGDSNLIEPIDPKLPITQPAARIDHPLNSRVTLSPEYRKRFKFPKEPNYGKLVYKSPINLLFSRQNDPDMCPDEWDCIVALANNDNDPSDISLFAFHTSQLRIPKDDNIDINTYVDNYTLRNGKQFMIGDEICIDADTPKFDRIRLAKYPCKAIVSDIFAGTSYMGTSASHPLSQVDIVFRCVVNNNGDCRTFYGFSGDYILFSEAKSRN